MHSTDTHTKHPISARIAIKRTFLPEPGGTGISFQLLKKLKQKDYKFKTCLDQNEFTANVVRPCLKAESKECWRCCSVAEHSGSMQ